MIVETGLIFSFATWLGSKIADKGFDSVCEKLLKKNEIDDKFKECVKHVANNLNVKYPDLLDNSIDYFFTQEKVFDELCKLLFVNQNVNPEVIAQSFDETTLPKDFILEFIKELKDKLSKEQIFQDIICNKELFITVKGVAKDVEDILSNTTLTYFEIIKLKETLEKQFKDTFSLDSFLLLYLKNLINNIGVVNFIGLGIDPSIKKGKRKEIDSIFVKPLFQLTSKYHIDEEVRCNRKYEDDNIQTESGTIILFAHLFDRPYNYVILGNPGAGKSLLIKSIMMYIAKKTDLFKNKKILTYIPFRIELKNYLTFKKNKGGNILKYLTNLLEEEFSVSSILEENLSLVFSTQKVIMFFDGIDEIFNVNDKIQIKNDIENFHHLFPNIRSITTSRFIGYNEAKLDESKFCELNILAFNKVQVKEYVTKWYLLEENNVETRKLEIFDFISKMNNIDNELLSNPLLLSLIVILYRNNLKIPDSKLEIYQSCTNTLVDKWDASKNLDIQIDNNILLKKEPIFSDLAFWQYETLSSTNTEVTYYKAKSIVAKSLIKKKIADEDNCDQLAEIFLNYAQKRSIYFDNNFTHKTFLEYYTAYWIYSNVEKKHDIIERNNLIRKYIANPFWFIVLELLLNLIDKDQPDTDILDAIVNEYIDEPDSITFLVYVLPNLKNISNEASKLVYVTAIRNLISEKCVLNSSSNKIKGLFNRIQNNFQIHSQQDIILSAIYSIEPIFWNNAFFAFINEVDFFYRSSDVQFKFTEIRKSDLYKKAINKDAYLYQIDDYEKSYDTKQYDYITRILKYISLFSVEEIFKDHKSVFDSFSLGGFISLYFYHQLKWENISYFSHNLNILSENNLRKHFLLNYLLNKRFVINIDNNILQFLIESFENSLDEVEKSIYFVLLKQGFSVKKYHKNGVKYDIEKFIATPKLKEVLKNLVHTNNPRKILEVIVADYNFTDKEVLQLVNGVSNIGGRGGL